MGSRLLVAGGVSLALNLVVWAAVGSALARQAVAPPPESIEIQRIVLHSNGKKTVKVVKPEEVKRKVARIVKEHHLTPPPKPKEPEPPRPAKTQPRRTEPTPSRHTAPPPPQGAHNRVLTSKATSAPKSQQFTALAGGNAPTGKPTEAQAPGTATTNPAEPPKVAPPPAAETKPDSKSTAPPPADPGPKTEPKVAPPPADPPKTAPPPPEKPKKKGPSRDAQHSNEIQPSIPDSLKEGEFKKFVRVRVDIAADGSFQVVLRTSSGNDEVDRRVLDALKRWTWKPKLVDGDPVDSTQLFKFEFEVK